MGSYWLHILVEIQSTGFSAVSTCSSGAISVVMIACIKNTIPVNKATKLFMDLVLYSAGRLHVCSFSSFTGSIHTIDVRM